jgi:putative transposase
MGNKRISYNRQSNRLQGYDYSSSGAYFVTIVSCQRLMLFDEATTGEMHFNRIGRIIEDCWLKIPKHFQSVTLDEYVVMPNHFHSVVNIVEHQNVGATHASPLREK